jgi:nicotinate-nucleotide adenylyltransferase
MAKIILFGGTFDPVHYGHLYTARAALQTLGMERVLFIPANTSPHKVSARTTGATPRQRLEMLRLAIADQPSMELTDIELMRPPPSFTSETLAILRRNCPSDHFTLLVGADQLPALHTWRDIQAVLETTPVAVLPRPGCVVPALSPGTIPQRLWQRVIVNVLNIQPYDISSTSIRRRIVQGLPVDDDIPAAVMDYIRRYGLYQAAGETLA